VAVRYREFSQGARQLAEFRGAASEKAEYFRRLTFERDELQSAAPRAGEKEELLGELARLASVEALTSISQNGIDLIEEPGAGLEAQFGRLLSLIETGVKKDRALGEVLELVRSAELQLREAKLSLSHYGANLEADPETLEALRERVAEIARLERKYGKAEEELVQYLSRISGELAQFESGAFDEEALQKKVDEARAKLRSVEAELTAERRAASERLTAGVLRELKEVSMKNASFVVSLGARESSPTGADEVSFLLSANPGQPPRELSKVASGGELSRILLVLKTALNDQANDQHGPPVQVFDEIDVGVGGAVAQAVGERIKKLSRLHQVILITHAPQIAALADTHLLVAKTTDKQSTVVGVRYLDAEGRTQEIARMLAGKKVTEKFEDSARELLGVGGKGRKKAANS
jgi:DNA repair protein RecN (Recombination protein N)